MDDYDNGDKIIPLQRRTTGNGHADARQQPTATPYTVPDPARIPARSWLHGKHYMRSIVVATVAPGGFGKSTLALHEALSIAVSGLRVWYISAEDDLNEISRRIAAYIKFHSVGAEQLNGRLFIDDKMSFPLKIARTERFKTIFNDVALAAFEQTIERNGIDVIFLDPFISFHLVGENDTAAMDAVIKCLADIASRRDCCIELSHHVRKPPNTGASDVTVYDARGAVAIINAVRHCRVINQMTKAVAEQIGVEDKDRFRFIRIDDGKANMVVPEAAKWMKLESVTIANGDHVQALSPYECNMQAQATNGDDDKAWLALTMTSKRFRVSSQSPQWLGLAMAKHFGRDSSVKKDRSWLLRTIQRWAGEGLIEQANFVDETRRARPYWVPGEALTSAEKTHGE